MLHLKRTHSADPDFVEMVQLLNADLKIRDGDDYDFYAQFNTISNLKYAVVAYWNDGPIGSGALKVYDEVRMEVKRMFVQPEFRKKGIASQILLELENWADSLGYSKCILETGKNQPEAIGMYLKNGYHFIPNYGQYEEVENSVCFEKKLTRHLNRLFDPVPLSWGLRGDPYLWKELKLYFATTPLPDEESDLVDLLLQAFEVLTGQLPVSGQNVRIERYPSGGMSGGLISADFWIGKAFPLLRERFLAVKKES